MASTRPYSGGAVTSVPLELLEALAENGQTGRSDRQSSGASGFDLEEWIARYALDVDGPKPWKAATAGSFVSALGIQRIETGVHTCFDWRTGQSRQVVITMGVQTKTGTPCAT